MKNERQNTTKPESCSVIINIETSGNTNIYNCSKIDTNSDCGCSDESVKPEQPTGVSGRCIPDSPNAKAKQSRKKRLDRILKHRSAPSALAASFIHTIKRFAAGKPAADEREQKIFEKFRGLSSKTRKLLKCTAQTYDGLPANHKTLFAQDLLQNINTPVTKTSLAKAFGNELEGIVNDRALGINDDPLKERAGKVRLYQYRGDDVYPYQVHIFKVNNLRTSDHVPLLELHDFLPSELQQVCTPRLNGEIVEWDCTRQQEPCPGESLNNVCLAVPVVQSGTSVTLVGVNFFDINAKIKMRRKETTGSFTTLDTFVYGDILTPATEIISGIQSVIADSRVTDQIFFTIPEETTPGIYEFYVEVPNTSGFSGPGFGDTLQTSNQYLDIMPPSTARFQIASETLWARKETSPEWPGSDEVGITIAAIPILPDFRIGSSQVSKFRFEDVDSEEIRQMETVLFSHTQPIAGVILSIMGFEIDSDNAYENQITEWTDVFYDILKTELEFLFDYSSETVDVVKWLAEKGFWGYMAIGIAAAVALAVNLFIALWAPADLIIQDNLAYSLADLVKFTNMDIPPPVANSDSNLYITEGEIKVRRMLTNKAPYEYAEERGYLSDDEDSWYNISFRYNRTV